MGRPACAAPQPPTILLLEQVYSRGLGPYFVTGTNHQQVVKGRTPRHRGVLMGRVVRVLADRVLVRPPRRTPWPRSSPAMGWSLMLPIGAAPKQREEGGRVYQVTPGARRQLEVQFGNGAINFARIRAGDLLWRTHDPELDKVVRTYTGAPAPVTKQPLPCASPSMRVSRWCWRGHC